MLIGIENEIFLYCLICIVFILAMFVATFELKYFFKIGNYAKKSLQDKNESDATIHKYPKASIIVYALNAEKTISEYLDSLLIQKYPDFEIIVVNDASEDNTALIVENYTLIHNNVYMTFMPASSHNISRRKMALTLGIKAAKGEFVITTSSDTIIQSPYWLANLMRHCDNASTDIILGYSHISQSEMKGATRWYRSFDSIIDAALWLGAAINKKAYRGDRHNLAFRKDIFFANKGYAKSMCFQNGDDDLFINQISTADNTCVEISPESQLILNWGKAEKRLWIDSKERYSFTAKYLGTKFFVLQRLHFLANWIVAVSCIALILLSFTQLFPLLIASFILLSLWTIQIITYRRVATSLQCIRLWWSVPFFMLLKPIVDIIYKMQFSSRKSKNYTWQRPNK